MKKLRAHEIFRDSRIQLIAVESINIRTYTNDILCNLSGNFEPIAVIVCSRDGNYALDMQGNPVALEQLTKDLPELYAMLTSFDEVLC